MRELIHIHNQGSELRADSREVAKLFGIQRESLHKLIENHTAQLEQLGHVRFEIGGGKIRPQGGGTPEKFAHLNFDQIAFLFGLSLKVFIYTAIGADLLYAGICVLMGLAQYKAPKTTR